MRWRHLGPTQQIPRTIGILQYQYELKCCVDGSGRKTDMKMIFTGANNSESAFFTEMNGRLSVCRYQTSFVVYVYILLFIRL